MHFNDYGVAFGGGDGFGSRLSRLSHKGGMIEGAGRWGKMGKWRFQNDKSGICDLPT
jgi:hypothetical protein